MASAPGPRGVVRAAGGVAPHRLLLLLLAEKVVQHVFVTAALVTDFHDIRGTVAVSPGILAPAGAVLAVLFAAALGATVRHRPWSRPLIAALALTDIIGEFAAQGTLAITLNVSFIVAVVLLALVAVERRRPIAR